MEDTLREILIEMLAYLEMGHAIVPTSVIHVEFKMHLLHGDADDRLARKMVEFEEDGLTRIIDQQT